MPAAGRLAGRPSGDIAPELAVMTRTDRLVQMDLPPPKIIDVSQETLRTDVLVEAMRKQERQEEAGRRTGKAFRQALGGRVDIALGTDFPSAPPTATFLSTLFKGVGSPLTLIAGDPQFREAVGREARVRLEERPGRTVSQFVGGILGFPLIAGTDVTRKVREGDIGAALGLGATFATEVGIIGGAFKGAGRLARPPRLLKGAARPIRPKLKLKKPLILTAKDFKKFRTLRELEPPKPPRITRVEKKGNQIIITVEAGGKVVERRVFTEGTFEPGVLAAQLQAAKAQGAMFINVKPPGVAVSPVFGFGVPMPQLGAADAGLQAQRQLGLLKGPGLLQASKQQQKQIEAESQRLGTVLSGALGVTPKQKQRQLTSLMQIQPQAQRQKQIQDQITRQSQAQDQAIAQAQKQQQNQLQKESQALDQKLSSALGRPGRGARRGVKPKPKRPRLLFAFPFFGGRPDKLLGKPKIQPGYNVFSQRRGRPFKLNRVPRSRNTALSMGGQYVDTTPAGSFTIRKAGKPARGPELDIFGNISHKFRPRRTPKALELVEKRKFRIDSLGELIGLSQSKGKRRLMI